MEEQWLYDSNARAEGNWSELVQTWASWSLWVEQLQGNAG
jgi:hypothetical protein